VILDRIRNKLFEEFNSLGGVVSNQTAIRRITISIDQIDVQSWLNSVPLFPKFYWADRSGSYHMATVGSVYQLQADKWEGFTPLFNQIQTVLDNSHPDLRFYGGLRFDPTISISPEWKNFGMYLFFVPLIEIIKTNKTNEISFYFLPTDGLDKQLYVLNDLATAVQPHIPRELSEKDICWREREDIPDKNEWQQNIGTALQLIKEGMLEKIVLARRTTLQFDKKIDSFALFNQLSKNYSNSFCFYFQLNFNSSFMGITPEMLFYREGDKMQGEAIAGTRPRSIDLQEDERLGKELVSSKKDLREHGWVLNEIENNFKTICENWQRISSNMITKQAYVQHLYTQFSGILKKNIQDYQILELFHPTPAVAGFPKSPSIKHIDALEKFDRGWYAGPIGWMSRKKTTFAVALRSALIQANQAFLYAGAGIVNGSEADKEWHEIENKLQNYLYIFKNV
jgi:menaquinone-specific isochorismate synthase